MHDAQGVQVLHARGDVHQAQQDCPLQPHKLLSHVFLHTASILFLRLSMGPHQKQLQEMHLLSQESLCMPSAEMGPADRSWTGCLQDARHGCTSLCVKQAERLTIVRLKRLLLMA